jgi:hypothetical protein
LRPPVLAGSKMIEGDEGRELTEQEVNLALDQAL